MRWCGALQLQLITTILCTAQQHSTVILLHRSMTGFAFLFPRNTILITMIMTVTGYTHYLTKRHHRTPHFSPTLRCHAPPQKKKKIFFFLFLKSHLLALLAPFFTLLSSCALLKQSYLPSFIDIAVFVQI